MLLDKRRAISKLHTKRAKQSKLQTHFARHASSESETMVGSDRHSIWHNFASLAKRNTKQLADITSSQTQSNCHLAQFHFLQNATQTQPKLEIARFARQASHENIVPNGVCETLQNQGFQAKRRGPIKTGSATHSKSVQMVGGSTIYYYILLLRAELLQREQ